MNTELQTMNNVYANLQSVVMQQGIAAMLPAQVTPEQFAQTAATALIENAELQKADKQSLVLALTRCAKDGLMPDGREATLVVRNRKVVYMPVMPSAVKLDGNVVVDAPIAFISRIRLSNPPSASFWGNFFRKDENTIFPFLNNTLEKSSTLCYFYYLDSRRRKTR